MSKFYAVRQGYKVGIFKDWDSCKSVIDGYKGAEFKSFKTEIEAQAYLNGEEVGFVSKTDSFVCLEKPAIGVANIYVDGGYKDGISSFGCYIETSDREFKFYGTVDYVSNLNNIAPEIFGVLSGVQLAHNLGFNNIVVCYDYEGLYKWYNNEWNAKGDLQARYVSIMHNIRLHNNLNLSFIKVKGHSIKGNKVADSLATKARNVGNCSVPLSKILNGTLACSDVKISNF